VVAEKRPSAALPLALSLRRTVGYASLRGHRAPGTWAFLSDLALCCTKNAVKIFSKKKKFYLS
jgi:hypothetical protein